MTTLSDAGASLLQRARRRAVKARGRGTPPRHVAAYDSVIYSQPGNSVRVEASFYNEARPTAIVASAGGTTVAESPTITLDSTAGAGLRYCAVLELEGLLEEWNTLKWKNPSWVEGQFPGAAKSDSVEEQDGDADLVTTAVTDSSEAGVPGMPSAADDLESGFANLSWRFVGEASSVPRGASRISVGSGDSPEAGTGPMSRKALFELLDQEALQPDELVTYHRGIGRYRDTTVDALPGVVSPAGSARPFINRRGYLVVAMNRYLKPTIQTTVQGITLSKGVLRLQGEARSRNSRVRAAKLTVVGRKEGHTFSAPASFSLDAERTGSDFGRGHYLFHAQLDFKDIEWSLVDNSENYDLWWEFVLEELEDDEEPVRARVNRTPYALRVTTRSDTVTRGHTVLVINPYYTFKAKATSLTLEVADVDAFAELQRFSPAKDAVERRHRRPVWIIGELPYKAQDNGLHFFRYMRNEHPEIDAYYVIDEDSPERANLVGFDHVLTFGSREHFRLALRADKFVGTHHADFLYPTRHPDFERKAHGTRIFLQHGVMGTKWMVPNYGKRAPGFNTDLFLVSSAREQEYIVSDFGYPVAETAVTGLPRFDSLLADDVTVNARQLLVIPTWRDWLQTDEVFADSEYLRNWSEFLDSPELAELVRTQGLDVVFCLHPNMQRFRHYFADAPARIVSQGEVDVQLLMKQSAAMVTDYSSVGFDFSFLGRPVLYLQFDRRRFLGRSGSHLDLDNELPGEVCTTVPELLKHLQDAADRGFSMTEEARHRSARFLVARDLNNCKRVFEAVDSARRQRGPLAVVASSEFMDRAENKWRRSRYYFPAMKAMQAVVRRLPMQGGLMVFESGLGKQYADSPRYIYEELVRRGDTRPKVWIYSGKQRFPDPRTRTVKRLSPAYFWYLARAQFWITNQNLPYYMTRRSRATYLQTWHGTPLKHMLHDMEEFQGRDEGYLGRVDRAISQWTHLLSPSPYATKVMRSAFAYTGEVVEEGYPRNDVFFSPDKQERADEVKKQLGIRPESNIVLYAPTFRDDASIGRGRFSFELPFDLEEFDRRFGADTVLLLRMHVLVSGALRIPEELQGRVINVSDYPEIQELYLLSDVLVTDYSSVFFDYAVLGRPIVFFAYDLELYRDTLRGFYLDYFNDLPGPVVQTEEEFYGAVAAALRGGRQGESADPDFIRRFAPKDDGHAASRVVDRVMGSDSGGPRKGVVPGQRFRFWASSIPRAMM